MLDKDSIAAGIYEMWQRRVVANVRELMIPKPAQEYFAPRCLQCPAS